MNQTVFDTKHRAELLLSEAIAFWKQSNHSEYFEDLKLDPAFNLLLSAIAFQANKTDNDIELLKAEVLDEYARLLLPYNVAHATPSTAVIQTMPLQDGDPVLLDAHSQFVLSDSKFIFSPVISSRILPVHVDSIVRLDGRRWRVDLLFDTPVDDISLFSFAIRNEGFRDLSLSIDGKNLSLIRPSDLSEFPYSEFFSIDHRLFNQSATFDASSLVLDLLVRENVRLYCIPKHEPLASFPEEVSRLSLTFEFAGLSPDFVFERSQLFFNVVLLANILQESAPLDHNNPIVRISGADDDAPSERRQLIQVLRPDADILADVPPVHVRRIAADRFNQASLIRLLATISAKIQSDFYAFQYLFPDGNSKHLADIKSALDKLLNQASSDLDAAVSGVYLILASKDPDASFTVSYLTTNGAATSPFLNERSSFIVAAGLAAGATRQIVPPVLGTDELNISANPTEYLRYNLITSDRLVTPADLRAFCFHHLLLRFGISANMIQSVKVQHRLDNDSTSCAHNACGFVIDVAIAILDSPYIHRSLSDKIPQTEMVMQSMMQARSANIYPICVHISIVQP